MCKSSIKNARESLKPNDIDDLHEILEMAEEAPKSPLRKFVSSSWKYVLGLSAFAEFFAFFVPILLKQEDVHEVAPKKKFGFLMFWKKQNEIELVVEQCVDGVKCMMENFLHWFEHNKELLGVVFCVIWFLEAIRGSFEARRKTASELEYKRLKKSNSERTAKETANDDLVEQSSLWFVFASTLFLGLSLLPVSFFITGFKNIGLILSKKDTIENSIQMYTLEKKYSLFYAVFAEVITSGSQLAKATLKSKIVGVVKKVSKNVMGRAVRNPVKFRRDMKKALTVLRWVKYLAPLIGTGNKLLGNTIDLFKKMKQKHEAEKAKRIRNKLWKKMTDEERMNSAAVVIQTCYRGKKARKARDSLELFKGNVQVLAIQKIQKRLREKARQASLRIKKQKEELKKLQQKQQQQDDVFSDDNAKAMSDTEKKRMYDLQASLKNEALSQKAQKMLLRPNTKFSVTWKFLFVFCVIVEITQLALKPQLQKYQDKSTKTPMSLEGVLESIIVPAPIPAWEACVPLYTEEVEADNFFKQLFGDKKNEEVVEDEFPWYCYEPAVTVQSWYIEAMKFSIHNLLFFIGIICFLDVFVTFFTGEINPKNGNLVPKPFFPRWILPGLLLQLLVNPKMADVSVAVKKIMNGAHHVGPARALRWGFSFVFPVITQFIIWFEWNVWMKLVNEENKHKA